MLALALLVLGCAVPSGALTTSESPSSAGEQVPLLSVDTPPCCYAMYSVIDVVADPTVGTAIKGNGEP